MLMIAYNCFMPEKTKKNTFYFIAALFIAAGLALRIIFYAYGRPFWNDEAALAINLETKTFWELFFPLVHEQVTPPLYAVLCKFCSVFTSKAEYAYRLPALFCGIVSLPVFLILAHKTLKNYCAKILAIALFTVNYQLIYYSQELKQYSCDVLLFLSILLSYFYIDTKKPDKKIFVALSIFYAISVWFSYTALFSIFTVFVLCLLKKTKTLKLFILPVLSCMGLAFFVKNYAADNALHNFWNNGFIAKDFSNLTRIIYNNIIFYFPDFNWKLLVVVIFLAGCMYVLKNIKNKENLILILPVLLAFFLSYFNIYPLYIRTALYLLPVVFLVMAKTFEFNFFEKKAGLITAGVLTVIFAIYTLKTDYIQILKKQYYRETTPQLLFIYQKTSQKGDKLIIPRLSAINYEYYSQENKLNNADIILVNFDFYEYANIKTAYNTLPSGTYYIMLTHSGDKRLELESLKKYAMEQKDFNIFADKFDNALIKFKK